MFKNQLQELAQRSCFNFPSYACIREGPDHAPRFKATVNFNGELFENPTFCTTLRQAEHAAAEVALHLLSKQGPCKALAARVLDETGVYKNLLQETAHKAGLKLPVYTTVRSGSGHVPVYSCMVELAGMSFTGEAAKTKKQAEKNAAISAWASLKQTSQSRSYASSSSSAPLVESVGNEEQEQIIVARFLATLQPAETNKSPPRYRKFERQQSSPVRRDLIPFGSENMQYQGWTNYPYFSPEIALHHNLSNKKPSYPIFPYTPQFFPFIRSIFHPNHGQYLLSREQEHAPFIPGMGSLIYFSNNSNPVPARNVSQVTIQEIEDNKQDEENDPIQLQANHNGHHSWNSPRCLDTRVGPCTTISDDTRFRLQNPQSMDYSQYNNRPSSSVSPVPGRAVNAAVTGRLRSENSHRTPRGLRNARCAHSANFPAPAVHIRSIVPVCSAPPVRKVTSASRSEGPDCDVTTVCSEQNEVQI